MTPGKLLPLSIAALFSACSLQRPLPPLPVLGEVPQFELVDQAGQPFDGQALDGKVWVADFIFTSCGATCPMMSFKMRQIQTSLKDSPDVKLVSFTVDPKNDTPEVLAGYAQRWNAEAGRWYFLTGAQDRLNSLALTTFKLNSVDGSLNHSTRFILIDRHGRIRGYYSTLTEDDTIGRLMRDIRRLERES